jgi:lysophospholipase L1-like esterase
VARFMADPDTSARARRTLAGLVLAAASVALALGVLEVGLRAAGWSRRLPTPPQFWSTWMVYDPVLMRKNQPGFVDESRGIRINALGLRGEEIAPVKPAGTVRIVCLGDSTTFGVFKNGPGDVRTSSVYPAALAAALHDAGYDRVEVVNAGRLGATSASGLALFLTTLRPLAPDVLVVRLGNNDHSMIRGHESPPLATDAEYAVLRTLPAWMFRLELVRLAFHAYRQWLATKPWATSGHQVPLDRYELNIRRLVADARAGGTRVLFLDFPYRELSRGLSPGDSLPNYFDDVKTLDELHAVHATYQAVTERVARETGSAYLRTEDALRAAPTSVFTDYDMSHLNDDGARLLARLVFEELRTLGWLGAPAKVSASGTPSRATAAPPADGRADDSSARGG